jgi:hypothetical protein
MAMVFVALTFCGFCGMVLEDWVVLVDLAVY